MSELSPLELAERIQKADSPFARLFGLGEARALGALLVLSSFNIACLGSETSSRSSSSSSSSSSTSTTSSIPSGAKAVKIIFKSGNPVGSFDAPATGGTLPKPFSGHTATRLFNADGTLLADSSSSTLWPKWLSGVEIGISGSSNTAASDPDCARFAGAGEETSTCHFTGDPSGPTTACGAPQGLFRVSEYDCVKNTAPLQGNGGPDDGVYIRVFFSRDTQYLGANENIMAVIEYAASVLNPAPANPTHCFVSGGFTPEDTRCSDMTWKTYLKSSPSDVVQPYLMLVPPALAFVDPTRGSSGTGGSGVSTKQFILPLSSNSGLSVFQLSRVKAIPASTPYRDTCGNGSSAANSPLCVGMIFYSLTLYRI